MAFRDQEEVAAHHYTPLIKSLQSKNLGFLLKENVPHRLWHPSQQSVNSAQRQGHISLFLEGHCPVKCSSKPYETHLNQLINISQVCWS